MLKWHEMCVAEESSKHFAWIDLFNDEAHAQASIT